jgi:diguanylate cyclase (GGDEF)-like protein
MVCAHVHAEGFTGFRCLPLVAQGETVGLLYMETQQGVATVESQELDVLVETVALSLVNLRLRERLRNQSIRDPLTGLFNRRYLEESLDLECSRAERSLQPLSVVMLDIDHFKRFNDTFGHEAGDVVLKSIAELLKASVRQGDIICRYGGEEFMLVLPVTGAPEAAALAERVRTAVKRLDLVHRGQSMGNITVSLGVATNTGTKWKQNDIVEAADQALYAAKNAGRNRVEVFERKSTAKSVVGAPQSAQKPVPEGALSATSIPLGG